MVKFLVVRFSSIGDIILTTPVVRALKDQVEDAQVHFLTKKRFSTLLKANPYIDKLHSLDNSFRTTLKELREEKFDYIIDLHRNIRTLRLKVNLHGISFTFDKLNWQKWMLVNFGIDKLPKKHIVDRYFQAVENFSVINDVKGLDYFIPEKETVDLNNVVADLTKPFLAMVVGGGHFTKQIPVQKLVEIINSISLPVVLLGGNEDKIKATEVIAAISRKVFNLTGQLTIHQSASVIQQAEAVITADTGMMHIASAFHKRIFSVWGNTVPEFGMYPYLSEEGSIIAQVNGLRCRPCSKIGYKKCPKGHFKCMMDNDMAPIIASVKKLKDPTK